MESLREVCNKDFYSEAIIYSDLEGFQIVVKGAVEDDKNVFCFERFQDDKKIAIITGVGLSDTSFMFGNIEKINADHENITLKYFSRGYPEMEKFLIGEGYISFAIETHIKHTPFVMKRFGYEEKDPVWGYEASKKGGIGTVSLGKNITKKASKGVFENFK